MTDTVDEVLDLREAAAYLKVGESTLRRLATDGEVYSFFVGGQRRFLRSRLIPKQPAPAFPAAVPDTDRARVAVKFAKFLIELPQGEVDILIHQILDSPQVKDEELWLSAVLKDDALLASVLDARKIGNG